MQMKGKYRFFNELHGIKRNAIALILVSLLITAGVSVYAIRKVDDAHRLARANGYLLYKGNRVPIQAIDDPKRNLKILLEGHVAKFHDLMFSLEPDAGYIKQRIENEALYMVDESGRRFHARLVGKGFYKDVVARGYRYEFKLDSINIDYSEYPFPYELFGKMFIEKGQKIYLRNLKSTGRLKEAGITEKNLNGIKIYDFEVEETKDLKL